MVAGIVLVAVHSDSTNAALSTSQPNAIMREEVEDSVDPEPSAFQASETSYAQKRVM